MRHPVVFYSIFAVLQGNTKMAAGDESYWSAYNAFRNRDNFLEVYIPMLSTIGSEVNFASVKSVLMLGPGEGRFEIEFIQKCTPNLAKLTAVEQDHESVERLRNCLRKALPSVEAQVIEGSFCAWKGLDDPIDLVLMFNVLYYWGSDERKQLLKNLHDNWLAAGGFLVVLSICRSHGQIVEQLGTPMYLWEDAEADSLFLEAGFTKRHVYEIKYTRDFTNPDDLFLRFYANYDYVGKPVTLDDVRGAAKELYPDGKARPTDILAVFQKAF